MTPNFHNIRNVTGTCRSIFPAEGVVLNGTEKLRLPTPDALLFDLDGVLADVTNSYRACIAETALFFGATVSPSEIAEEIFEGNGNNDWVVTHRLLSRRGITTPFEGVVEVFQHLYLGDADQSGYRDRESLLIELDCLDELAARYALAIITGRPRSEAEAFLTRFQIEPYFDFLIAMEDAPLKPNPEGVLTATRNLGASRPWMIGDTPDDMQAACGAGTLAIGIGDPAERQSTDALLNAGAQIVLPDINKLKEILP